MQDGPGYGSPLLHAVGQGADPVTGAAIQSNAFEDGIHPGLSVPESVQPGKVVEVFLGREVIVEEGAMTHDADSPAYLGGLSSKVPASDMRRPGIGSNAGRQDSKECGLPRTVGTKQGECFAPRDG